MDSPMTPGPGGEDAAFPSFGTKRAAEEPAFAAKRVRLFDAQVDDHVAQMLRHYAGLPKPDFAIATGMKYPVAAADRYNAVEKQIGGEPSAAPDPLSLYAENKDERGISAALEGRPKESISAATAPLEAEETFPPFGPEVELVVDAPCQAFVSRWLVHALERQRGVAVPKDMYIGDTRVLFFPSLLAWLRGMELDFSGEHALLASARLMLGFNASCLPKDAKEHVKALAPEGFASEFGVVDEPLGVHFEAEQTIGLIRTLRHVSGNAAVRTGSNFIMVDPAPGPDSRADIKRASTGAYPVPIESARDEASALARAISIGKTNQREFVGDALVQMAATAHVFVAGNADEYATHPDNLSRTRASMRHLLDAHKRGVVLAIHDSVEPAGYEELIAAASSSGPHAACDDPACQSLALGMVQEAAAKAEDGAFVEAFLRWLIPFAAECDPSKSYWNVGKMLKSMLAWFDPAQPTQVEDTDALVELLCACLDDPQPLLRRGVVTPVLLGTLSEKRGRLIKKQIPDGGPLIVYVEEEKAGGDFEVSWPSITNSAAEWQSALWAFLASAEQ